MPMAIHTQWMNCSLFRDRLPASQVPQEQRFTTTFTIFWVSFGCMLWFTIQRTSQITRTQRDECLFWFLWRVNSWWLFSASSGLFSIFFPNIVYWPRGLKGHRVLATEYWGPVSSNIKGTAVATETLQIEIQQNYIIPNTWKKKNMTAIVNKTGNTWFIKCDCAF